MPLKNHMGEGMIFEEVKNMPESHALLSASSSKQWLNCPPSARLQEKIPNESSVYAEEGTYAHSVCEYKVRRYLHGSAERPESGKYESEEIEQITDVYAEFVIRTIEEMKRNGCEPLALAEERVDYSHLVPEGFGTADMIMIGRDEAGKGLLHIADFKTGKGVYVDAEYNSQLMLYALGALHAYGSAFPIETIRMTIVQPRLDNISTFECTRQELEAWGESIRPTAQLAYEGKGEQKCGDWCRFCRARPTCRACAEEALALAREEFLDLEEGAYAPIRASPEERERPEPVFRQPGLIPFHELEEILPALNRISEWIESVFAYAAAEAINKGVPVKGYKVVEGRSKRVFTDLEAVEETAMKNGYTDLYKKELISLAEFEKKMGKKRFAELLGPYVAKPPGKPALVPDSDPRPPIMRPGSPEQEFTALPAQDEA